MKKHYIFLTILTIVIVSTIVYGLMDGGSPKAARDMQYDQTRTQHVLTLQSAIISYYRQQNRLPENLSALAITPLPVDPETNAGYEYSVVSQQVFKLCATFATDTQSSQNVMERQSHPKGYYCYTQDVNTNN